MYCYDLKVMSLNPGQPNMGCVVLVSKAYLIKKYQSIASDYIKMLISSFVIISMYCISRLGCIEGCEKKRLLKTLTLKFDVF